jgi:hypothetical protein
MLPALLLALSLADWVPARWTSDDPKSLELLAETPINCLLAEHAPAAFAAEAKQRGIAVLAVVRPGGDLAEAAKHAVKLGLDGIVLEGDLTLLQWPRSRTSG